MCIEFKRKSIRPIYPVICFQLQGLTWCALRLPIQTEEKIDGEGQPSSIVSTKLYILFLQLCSIVFSLLVHIFFKKCLLKITPIHRLYKNSSSKILLLCFIIDFASIESVVCGSITKTIKYLKIVIEEYTPTIAWLNDTSRMNILNVIKIICRFLLKSLILLCYLGFWLLVFLFLLVVYFAAILIGLFYFVIVLSYFVYLPLYAIFGLVPACVFTVALIILIAFTMVAEPVQTSSRLLFDVLEKFLFVISKTFLFLFFFMPYYSVISGALYLLACVLPFGTLETIHFLIVFLLFSSTTIGFFFLCRKSKKTWFWQRQRCPQFAMQCIV